MEFDFAELSPGERYKLLGGLVVPRPIALVTTRAPDGRHNAAPFSAPHGRVRQSETCHRSAPLGRAMPALGGQSIRS